MENNIGKNLWETHLDLGEQRFFREMIMSGKGDSEKLIDYIIKEVPVEFKPELVAYIAIGHPEENIRNKATEVLMELKDAEVESKNYYKVCEQDPESIKKIAERYGRFGKTIVYLSKAKFVHIYDINILKYGGFVYGTEEKDKEIRSRALKLMEDISGLALLLFNCGSQYDELYEGREEIGRHGEGFEWLRSEREEIRKAAGRVIDRAVEEKDIETLISHSDCRTHLERSGLSPEWLEIKHKKAVKEVYQSLHGLPGREYTVEEILHDLDKRRLKNTPKIRDKSKNVVVEIDNPLYKGKNSS